MSSGRAPIIAGNWKMHNNSGEAIALVEELATVSGEHPGVDVVVCPPFTALMAVRDICRASGIGLGGQNMFWKSHGAYTGQISAPMLLDAGAEYVIIGHSESRGRFGVPEPDFDEGTLSYFGDNDATVNRKLRAALAAGLTPICCVGETFDERREGRTDAVVQEQTAAAICHIDADRVRAIVFAYEPVWAIGTGEVCLADEADRVCSVIRSAVGDECGGMVARSVRVQYGGSVKPDNARELLNQPNIDGALVGGASLKASDFCAIVRAAPHSTA